MIAPMPRCSQDGPPDDDDEKDLPWFIAAWLLILGILSVYIYYYPIQ